LNAEQAHHEGSLDKWKLLVASKASKNQVKGKTSSRNIIIKRNLSEKSRRN